jgi:hypothetical protein
MNARKGVEIRNILEEMDRPPPPTPVQTDNSTADGIINLRVMPKRRKATDMRFHWLSDWPINQEQFRIFWRPGATIGQNIIPPSITIITTCEVKY